MAPLLVDARELNVRARIGVSSFPDDVSDATALTRRAGLAMYRNYAPVLYDCRFYPYETSARVVEHLTLENCRRAV